MIFFDKMSGGIMICHDLPCCVMICHYMYEKNVSSINSYSVLLIAILF